MTVPHVGCMQVGEPLGSHGRMSSSGGCLLTLPKSSPGRSALVRSHQPMNRDSMCLDAWHKLTDRTADPSSRVSKHAQLQEGARVSQSHGLQALVTCVHSHSSSDSA